MVLRLEPLSKDHLRKLVNNALSDKEKGLGNLKINITEEAIDYLITIGEGDGRTV